MTYPQGETEQFLQHFGTVAVYNSVDRCIQLLECEFMDTDIVEVLRFTIYQHLKLIFRYLFPVYHDSFTIVDPCCMKHLDNRNIFFLTCQKSIV